MSDNTSQQGQGNESWSPMDVQADMRPQGPQDDLGRWSQFGVQGGDMSQQEGMFPSEWATADDLVNSIVGATMGMPSQQVPTPADQPQGHDTMPAAVANPHSRPAVSEYGAWELRTDHEHGSAPQRASRPHSTDGAGGHAVMDSWPSPDDMRGGNRFSQDDKAGRKGRFTSVIAFIFAVMTLLVAVSPIMSQLLEEEKWVVTLLSSLPLAVMVALPATLLGLQSATKPKGQVGKKRGIAAVVISSVSLVVSAGIVTSSCVGFLHQVNEEKAIAQDQTSSSTTTIVFPGGSVTLDNKAIKVLMKVGLMPDNTLDDGEIRISSYNGKIYIGSKEIDPDLVVSAKSMDDLSEASGETLENLRKCVETLDKHGISITTNGKTITLKDREGHIRVLSPKDIIEETQEK